MRTNKAGKPSIPAVAWRFAASVHQKAANDLMALLERADIDGLSALALAIAELTRRHNESAETCRSAAAKTGPGRPKSSPVNELMLMQAAKGKRNVGAPVKFGPRYDIATYLFVEERRALIAKRNLAKPTIANAIESLNEEIANDEGCRKLDYTKEFRYHTRSSYQRGKRLVEADQNPK